MSVLCNTGRYLHSLQWYQKRSQAEKPKEAGTLDGELAECQEVAIAVAQVGEGMENRCRAPTVPVTIYLRADKKAAETEVGKAMARHSVTLWEGTLPLRSLPSTGQAQCREETLTPGINSRTCVPVSIRALTSKPGP